MFIDTTNPKDQRSERSAKFPAMNGETPAFRCSGARKIYESGGFYKHYVPTGRQSLVRKTLPEKQELRNLLHR